MDIFIINLNESSNIPEEQLLEFKKKEFSNRTKLIEHCFSYFMLDKILQEKYGIKDREIIFNNGKPILKSGEKHFSLSHSRDFVALAFSDYNCGIDIEEKRPRDFEKIAERMNFNCKSLDEFYKEWTLFEASYKLGEKANKIKIFNYENYTVCAVSSCENDIVTT